MKIDLQNKTYITKAVINTYFFENRNIALEKKLFHKITLFLKDFDSGLEYEENPVYTQIILDWYNLKLPNPSELHGLDLSHKNYCNAEGSIYLGYAYNWCDVEYLRFSKKSENSFFIDGKINIEFENEQVAQNEEFIFKTVCVYENN